MMNAAVGRMSLIKIQMLKLSALQCCQERTHVIKKGYVFTNELKNSLTLWEMHSYGKIMVSLQ